MKFISILSIAIMLFMGSMNAMAQSKVIYTGELGKKVNGYQGNTPVKITIENGKITNIEMGDNQESPRYLKKATNKIFPQYIGKTVDEALKVKADGATGATYSSNAIIKNIQLGLQEAKKNATAPKTAKKKATKKKKK